MNMNPLPPQAYTKETLGKAFAWLQSQSENIKEMATSPDVLVSLYLKAKLNGTGALDRPSIQNFKSELKSLAGMMGEFEVMDPAPNLEARVQGELQRRQSSEQPTPPAAHPPLPHRPPMPPPVLDSSSQVLTSSVINASPAAGLSLDEKSWAMIREVKGELNMSSDTETLRLLISAGFKNLKKL